MKRLFFLLSMMQLAFVANAQFGINVGISPLKFTGDVGKNGNTNFFANSRLAYNIGADYRIGKVMGVGLNGIYGTLQGTDNNSTSHRNFKSTIYGGELNLYAFFDRFSDTEKVVSPFISAGIGYLMFDPHADMKDANGVPYVYWSDGSIRDLPEVASNDAYAVTMKRDYTYETQLKDSAVNYSRSTLYLPLSIGGKFQAGFRTSFRVALNYNLAFSDYIDNYKSGGNDSWMGANLTVNIKLAKKPRDVYDGIDFTTIDNMDYDADGVVDDNDKCLGTPRGAVVDGRGCPVDTDDDGVPDYLDKEPHTKKNTIVDGYGVTINVEDVYKRQLEWDSLAVERSDEFNAAPSFSYLKRVEVKGKEIMEKSGKESNIPEELKPADINGDGFISADEITKTIDSFFEGNPDFNVERINRLIDFFFEQ